MSTARRAFDMMRGYVNHGWDYIRGPEETDADRELREAIEQPVQNAARQEAQPPDPPLTVEMARKFFDLQPNATSRQITDAYEDLRKTIDPEKFPDGSAAYLRARQLRRRIDAARQVLLDNMDPMVRRFEGLEID